jgi:hypothetical protein
MNRWAMAIVLYVLLVLGTFIPVLIALCSKVKLFNGGSGPEESPHFSAKCKWQGNFPTPWKGVSPIWGKPKFPSSRKPEFPTLGKRNFPTRWKLEFPTCAWLPLWAPWTGYGYLPSFFLWIL